MSLKSDPATWTDQRQLRGLHGEQVAMRYLTFAGWRVTDHRFRMGRLEIDLVARKEHLVAFVEVKTRWSNQFGRPTEAVTWSKRREIARVATAWIDRHGRPDDVYRFDMIGVTLSQAGPHRLEHVEDAFRVGWR
jgi:putative endonuclease